MSHLLQMRGLKLLTLRKMKRREVVASFTDAWIETRICGIVDAVPFVASFTDAWIETFGLRAAISALISRIFYRCVD